MPRSLILNKLPGFRAMRDLLGNRFLHTGLVLLALLVTVAILVFNNLLMPRYTRSGSVFNMPSVEGLSRTAAAETLLSYDLGATRWDTVLDFSVPRSTVLTQSPRAGAAVKPGRTVYLRLSDNTRDSVMVPDLVNASISDAAILIRRAQLRPRVLPDAVPAPYPDVVLRQHPESDLMVLRHDTVTIWFSTGLGNRLVEVPELAGLSVSSAQQQLRTVGLYAKVSPLLHDTGADPVVLTQSQPAGSRLREGSELILFWKQHRP